MRGVRLIKVQLTFFAGLAVGLVTLFVTELVRDVRDYQRGWFYE